MTKLIKDFGMSGMTIGACCDFHDSVYTHIKSYTPAALHIEALAPLYEAALAQLQSVVNRKRALASTELLRVLDRKRDNGIGVVNGVVNVYLKALVDAKREAAIRMSADLKAYNGIGYHEYRKQTSELKGMIAVLTSEEHAADIETLGLTADVEALAQVAEEFKEAYLGKAAEVADTVDQSDLDSKELVQHINQVYANIVQMVNAYAIVQPTEAINGFIHDLNGLVKTYSDFSEGGATGGTAEGVGDGNESDGTDEPDGADGSDGADEPNGPDETTPDEGGVTPPPSGGNDDDGEVVG